MNKYTLLGLIVFIMVFMTYIVDMVSGFEVTTEVNGILVVSEETSIVSVVSMIKTFFNILTFSIPDMPVIINFTFYGMGVAVMFMIIDVIKDLVPFT